MAFENRIILFIASGVLAMTAILYIIANGLPIWAKASGKSGSSTAGLWHLCDLKGAKLTCTNIGKVTDRVMAARAFMTISCILAPLSVVSILLIRFVNEDLKKNISLLAKGLAFTTLISGIIGVSIGISLVVGGKNLGVSIGVSCILAIIGLVFNIAGTIITFFIK